MSRFPRTRIAAGALAAGVLAAGALAGPAGAATAKSQSLKGTFKIGKGSYFRMVVKGGTVKGGKFLENASSTATDKTYTPLLPGADGGLRTGRYQPGSAFDAKGNSLAGRIIKPTGFFGTNFGLLTAAKDPQTGLAVAAPSITVKNGKLTGKIAALSASWNKQFFNQGTPKPDGKRPGLTQPVSGTYSKKTGRYVLTWASQIVGGPFDGFTGVWRLTGAFVKG